MHLIVIVEGRTDARTACDLADRVLVERGPFWLDASTRDVMRAWSGLAENTKYTTWSDVKQLAKEHGVRNLGFLSTGKPGGIDSAQGRKAIILHNRLTRDRNAPALLLIRDLDNQPERRHGLEQARNEPESEDLTVVIGVANPEREAWVLNGFEPASQDEADRLAELQDELSFDPCTEAERLRGSRGERRSAKRVLDVLTSGSTARETQCWQTTDLAVLEERGQATGLSDYLDEIEEYVLPLFTEQDSSQQEIS